MPARRRIELAPNDRLLLVGQTRVGKSTWLRQPAVLPRIPAAIVLDTKAEAPWVAFARRYGYEIVNGERMVRSALRSKDCPPRILARCFDPLGGEAAALTLEIFQLGPRIAAAHRAGAYTCIVDEGYHWCRGDFTHRGLRLIWTMGGGLGVGGWVGCQRPMRLAQELLSESTQRVIFRLELRQDRAKLDFVPGAERAAGLDAYWWLHHVSGQLGPARLMRPVRAGG